MKVDEKATTLSKDFLCEVGLSFYDAHDFCARNIILRDGREAILWVHNENGHGVLDKKYWGINDTEAYYEEDYRDQFNCALGAESVSPEAHKKTYSTLNRKQSLFLKPYLTADSKYLEIGCSFWWGAKSC